MKVKVYAKLNLSLNVGERQGQFHKIDSVVTSIDLFDVVTVTLREDATVTLSCSADVPTLQNSAYRAAVEFQKEFGPCGCSIDIVKGIPMGAGFGGSSADAAAVVYCLCTLFKVDAADSRVKALCARIGSDVNFMLSGGLARMTGKGDDVEFLPYCQVYFAVTTFPVAMSTKDVYERFDEIGAHVSCDNDKMAECFACGRAEQALTMCCNGLESSVRSISSYSERYLAFCRLHNINCTMTGSGSAYFVPCVGRDEAESIAKTLSDNGFSTVAYKSVARGVETVSVSTKV